MDNPKMTEAQLAKLREHMATMPPPPEPDPDPEVNVTIFDESCDFETWADGELETCDECQDVGSWACSVHAVDTDEYKEFAAKRASLQEHAEALHAGAHGQAGWKAGPWRVAFEKLYALISEGGGS